MDIIDPVLQTHHTEFHTGSIIIISVHPEKADSEWTPLGRKQLIAVPVNQFLQQINHFFTFKPLLIH